MTEVHPLHRLLKVFLVLITLGIAGLVALFGEFWLERQKDVTLPEPTGPFAVGRVTYAWSDETPDTLAPDAGTKREIFVWIWYPAAGHPGKTYEYLPTPWRKAIDNTRAGIIRLMALDLSKVHSHSLPDE